jgi:hypothetical protein
MIQVGGARSCAPRVYRTPRDAGLADVWRGETRTATLVPDCEFTHGGLG